MLPKKKLPPLLLILAIPLSSTFAEANLDQILEEIIALREQVTQLENRIDELEKKPTPVVAADEPNEKKEKRKWFDSMRVELKKAELRASGSWTQQSSWDQIQTGMKKEEALAILGEPTDFKFSVRRDTDEILIYQGDLEGNGESVYGEIRIYKGKIRRFVTPDLPAE